MQEKSACIYVVATANNIDKLPPEFLRRGRFDEIFQVGFPNKEERKEILKLHIKRRNRDSNGFCDIPSTVDIDQVANKFNDNDNYSGADIESIVKEAMERVFVDNVTKYGRDERSKWKKLTTETLINVINETKSSYQSQKEKLDKMLNKLKSLGVKNASK
jgi:SpoVK/Ycf46/Vps4 family AAA+-type ATPase